jgi:pyruvate formate lyase activating enzyme
MTHGDGPFPARHWSRLEDGRIRCEVCPRLCRLKDGQRGLCFVRQAVDGALVLDTYGRSSGFCVDPIEKKPLNHALPGSRTLSFGTAGCNLACKFCQNHDISKSRDVDRLARRAVTGGHRAGRRGGRLPLDGLHL